MDTATSVEFDVPIDSLTKLGAAVNGVLDEIPDKEERRYAEHAIRVKELLDEGGFTNDGMLLAAEIHDGVAYALDNTDTAAETIWTLLSDVLREKPDKEVIRYAIGIAVSAHEWEERAETWRDKIGEDLDQIANPLRRLSRHARQTREYIEERFPNQDRESTRTIAREVRDAIADSNSAVTPNVKRFNVGITDVGTLLDDLRVHDVEGLILQAAELDDNIRKPNTSRPASEWQDIHETLNYWVPALEFAGLEEFANIIRDGSLRALYKDTAVLDEAEQRLLDSLTLCDEVTDQLKVALRDMHDFGDLKETRVKSSGSRADSMAVRSHEPADGIGFRVIVDDTLASDDVIAKARQLQASLEEAGFVAYHPRSLDDRFEAFVGDNKRNTEYEAVHMTFSYAAEDGTYTTVEVQLMTSDAYENNQTRASHTLYKAIYGADDLSRALAHRAQGEATEADWALINTCVSDIEDLRSRKAYFFDKQDASILNSKTLSALARIEQLQRVDPVLQIVADMDVANIENIVISPESVSPETFRSIAEQLMPGLWDEEFERYFKLAQFIHKNQSRDNGESDHFTGHILPGALGLMYKLAHISKFDDQQNFKDWIIVSLLHDSLEDYEKELENDPEALAYAAQQLELLPQKIKESILRLTKPEKTEAEKAMTDQVAASLSREKRSIEQLTEDEMYIKAFERMSNLRTDLRRLERIQQSGESDADKFRDIQKYFNKCVYIFDLMRTLKLRGEMEWIASEYRKYGIG